MPETRMVDSNLIETIERTSTPLSGWTSRESRWFKASWGEWILQSNSSQPYNYTPYRFWRSSYCGPRLKGADHNLDVVINEIKDPQCLFRRYNGSGTSYVEYNGIYSQIYVPAQLNEYQATSLPVPETIVQSAIYEVRSQLADQKMDVMTNLAELGETVNFIADVASTLSKAAVRAKHGDFPGVCKELGIDISRTKKAIGKNIHRASDAWLAWRYGAMPMVYSVEDTVLAFADRYEKRGDIVEAQVHRKWEDSREFSPQNDNWLLQKSFVRRKFGMTYNVRMRVLNPSARTMAQLGVTSVPRTAWEIIPLSFVADWFLPIGDYLESLTAEYGLEFVSGYLTKKDELIHGFGDYSMKTTVLSRSILSECPWPPFPVFSPSISLKRLADATALLSKTLK